MEKEYEMKLHNRTQVSTIKSGEWCPSCSTKRCILNLQRSVGKVRQVHKYGLQVHAASSSQNCSSPHHPHFKIKLACHEHKLCNQDMYAQKLT